LIRQRRESHKTKTKEGCVDINKNIYIFEILRAGFSLSLRRYYQLFLRQQNDRTHVDYWCWRNRLSRKSAVTASWARSASRIIANFSAGWWWWRRWMYLEICLSSAFLHFLYWITSWQGFWIKLLQANAIWNCRFSLDWMNL